MKITAHEIGEVKSKNGMSQRKVKKYGEVRFELSIRLMTLFSSGGNYWGPIPNLTHEPPTSKDSSFTASLLYVSNNQSISRTIQPSVFFHTS